MFGKEDHHAQPPPSRRRRFLPLPSRPLLSCSGVCKSPAARPTMPNPSGALPKWKPSPLPGASSWTATEPFWPRIRVTWSAVLAEDVEDQVVRRLKTLCQEEDVAWEGTGPIAGVTPRLLARVKEEGLAGVSFTPAVQRVGSGTLAPHVLGRVGQMSPEEWEVYQDRGYAMDETVGKDGAEGAFESYLHGYPGPEGAGDRQGRPDHRGDQRGAAPGGAGCDPDPGPGPPGRGGDGPGRLLGPPSPGHRRSLVALDVRNGGVLAMVSQPGV
ncbi:MAG: hypothetical protein ACLR1T_11720 [Evtepia gabavorous]